MLGNQFFMAWNYPAAQKELEEVYFRNPGNISYVAGVFQKVKSARPT